MHWLPLVAMVIASALPFPHDPASRIVAATTTTTITSYSDLGSQDRSATTSSSASSPHHDSVDYSSQKDYKSAPMDYKSAPMDNNMADGKGQNRKDVLLSSSNDDRGVYELNLANTLDVPPTEGQSDAKMLTRYANMDFNANYDRRDLANAGLGVTSQRTEGGFLGNLDSPSELDGLFEGGDLFLDSHPRVLFSTSVSPPEHPPEQLMFGDEEEAYEEGELMEVTKAAGLRREKRSHSFDGRWVQRSVCESENRWVTDKTTAVDTRGNKVSIIQEIQTQSGPIKQYFYETRCRQAEHPQGGRYEETGVEGASCLGIDRKQWKSKCIAKQSFVRALTKDGNNRVGWRWIRIDSSCVCVLMSRTNSRGQQGARETAPGRGRG